MIQTLTNNPLTAVLVLAALLCIIGLSVFFVKRHRTKQSVHIPEGWSEDELSCNHDPVDAKYTYRN